MIILPAENHILRDTVKQKLTAEKREACEVTLFDFDSVSYKLLIDKDAKNILNVRLNAPYWKSIQAFGGEDATKAVFGDCVSRMTDDGPELKVNIDDCGDKDEMAAKIGRLRATACGGPWRSMCLAIREGNVPKPLKFKMREDTKVFIVPQKDRVVTCFALDYENQSDKVIAETILTEFAAVRKKDRTPAVQSGPLVGWYKNPPGEIQGLDVSDCSGMLGYLIITMTKKHFADDTKMIHSIDKILGFRSFLLYHLKCAKAHFHQTMRARVTSLLKVLNQAKPDAMKKAKQKKKSKK